MALRINLPTSGVQTGIALNVEVRGQLVGVDSLLPPSGFEGIDFRSLVLAADASTQSTSHGLPGFYSPKLF